VCLFSGPPPYATQPEQQVHTEQIQMTTVPQTSKPPELFIPAPLVAGYCFHLRLYVCLLAGYGTVEGEFSVFSRVAAICYGTFAWTICVSVCLCVCKVYCGKTADWIRMPFRVVSEVGRGMCVLDRVGDRRREGQFWGNEFGASHCNQWGLCDAALLSLL